ncbi:M28 family peptidase [Spirosoma sp. KUDC1026]|uniref:M28 family peptidase n=1 Tax=Spirosoma sp. KUDC1026 TaxID=2745947 RepID=UPI00159BB485|nr:M28 family peptidase [Spirosoma sp. KUDC1026]QKZ13318.1 M28 family peptidase [Spirosoma sp. KUDC1026]
MKKLFLSFTLLVAQLAYSQSNMAVTNSTADAVMAGSYSPSAYTGGLTLTPTALSTDLNQSISADSVREYVRKLASFGTRQTNSLFSSSTTTGLGAANNWIEAKFRQISKQRTNRLLVSRMTFNAAICSSTTRTYNEVFAVLPGSDLTDKSFIVVEGHVDSRCDDACNATCNAAGVSDNATGSALVIEAARVLSKYNLKATVVFLLTIGEEQSLYGSKAFANYSAGKNRAIRMVLNNDIAGTTLCGPCSSSPSCVAGTVANNSIRIFSYGSANSIQKQMARYIKLEYNEQIKPATATPMTINIMSGEDRTGRSGDHVPFRSQGYAAVRLVSQNENGDGTGSCGIVHTSKDNEQIDTNNDGIIDDFSVDFNYLARNAVINSNAIAMAAQSVVKPASFTAKYASTNKISLTITDASNAPAYRIALRSLTNDWDSVYTVSTKTPTIAFLGNSSSVRYVSVAAVNSGGAESLFSGEVSVNVPATSTASSTEPKSFGFLDRLLQAPTSTEAGLEIVKNYPNPFDESTYLVLKNESNKQYNDVYLTVRKGDGTLLERRKIEVRDGINEYLFSYKNEGRIEVLYYTFEADGRVIATNRMLLGVRH